MKGINMSRGLEILILKAIEIAEARRKENKKGESTNEKRITNISK